MKRSACQKLDGVAINGDFCEPPRFFLIRAAYIDPIENMAVRPNHIGAVFLHLLSPLQQKIVGPKTSVGLSGNPTFLKQEVAN